VRSFISQIRSFQSLGNLETPTLTVFAFWSVKFLEMPIHPLSRRHARSFQSPTRLTWLASKLTAKSRKTSSFMVWKSRICHVIDQHMCSGKIQSFLTKHMHKSPNTFYIECLQTPNLHPSYRIFSIHEYPLYHTSSHIFKAKTPWPILFQINVIIRYKIHISPQALVFMIDNPSPPSQQVRA
jgi:hypothetical protein